MQKFLEYGLDYVKYQPFEQQIYKPSITFIQNKKLFNAVFYLKRELPINVLNKVAKIPGLMSAELKKTARLGLVVNQKTKELYDLFSHFTSNSWTFETLKIYEFMNQLSL